jgi:hypothetical protein
MGEEMNGSTVITIDDIDYHVKYSICRGSRAARENGQPISPDEPPHIDDMEVYFFEKIRVTNQKIIDKAYEILSEEL